MWRQEAGGIHGLCRFIERWFAEYRAGKIGVGCLCHEGTLLSLKRRYLRAAEAYNIPQVPSIKFSATRKGRAQCLTRMTMCVRLLSPIHNWACLLADDAIP